MLRERSGTYSDKSVVVLGIALAYYLHDRGLAIRR